jgi:hypothetical protein
MTNKTHVTLGLALSLGAMVGCDPTKQLQSAKEERAETVREVQKDQAELQREQVEEAAKLARKQEIANTGEAKDIGRELNDQALAADKLALEQGKDQVNLDAKANEKIAEANAEVHEAAVKVEGKRADIVAKERERLSKIEARANELRSKAAEKSRDVEAKVDAQLTGFETAWKDAETDLGALEQVAAANLDRSKNALEKKLATLEKRLDRADDAL